MPEEEETVKLVQKEVALMVEEEGNQLMEVVETNLEWKVKFQLEEVQWQLV